MIVPFGISLSYGLIPSTSSQEKFLLSCSPSQLCFIFFFPRGKFQRVQLSSIYFSIPTRSQNHQCVWLSFTSTLPHLETFLSRWYSNPHFFSFLKLMSSGSTSLFFPPFLFPSFSFSLSYPALLSLSLLRYNLYVVK